MVPMYIYIVHVNEHKNAKLTNTEFLNGEWDHYL